MPMCISLSTTIPRERATWGRDWRSASATRTAASSASSRAGPKRALRLISGPAGEGEANDFVVVTDNDVAVRVGRVGPEHVGQLTAPDVRVGRRDEGRAADLLETLGRKLCHHELAAVIVDEVPIVVTHEERGAIHGVLLEERV